MSDVLILTNRRPAFFTKFVEIVFGELAEEHDVTFHHRTTSLLETTLSFVSAVLSERPDVVVVIGSGFATVWTCLVGKLLPGTTVVFHHNDFTYQHMRDFKDVGRGRLLVERIQEGWPLRLADVVGTLTPYQESYLREKGITKPFVRILHGVWTDEFEPDAGDDIRADLGIAADELVVGVVGTFNYSAETDLIYGWSLLEALAELDDDIPVVGLLVGGGDGVGHLNDRIEELGIENRVVHTGYVDHDDLPPYLGAMDASLLVKPDHPADKMTTTMKLPEYLAAGTYVIADDHAYASTILDPEKASLLPYDGIRDDAFPERLAAELAELTEDEKRIKAGQCHAREVAERMFDYAEIRRDVRERIEQFL